MKRIVLTVGLTLLPLSAHAQCIDPKAMPPNDAQIRAMPTAALYSWLKLAQRASDAAATATVLRGKDSVSPCVQELLDRQPAIERELRFR